MSVRAVRAVLDIRDRRLSPAERFVLLAYAEHANKDTEKAWPSARLIADETGYNEDTVSRATGKLRRLGYLVQVGKRRHGDRAWTWVYEVHPEDPLVERDVNAEEPTSRRRGTDLDAVEEPTSRRTNRKREPEVEPIAARQTRTDPLWDALVGWLGWNQTEITDTARGWVNRELRSLRQLGATPEQIVERADLLASRMGRGRVTPTSLARHWASLTPSAAPSRDTWLAAR